MLIKLREAQEDRETGFTLIELLVVILIIGILSAIAVPAFLNQRKSAIQASLQADIRSVQLVMETCGTKASAITYPDIWVDWGGNTQKPGCSGDLKLSEGTQIHAFDISAYYPALGFKAKQAYCIEARNSATPESPAVTYRSDKGKAGVVMPCHLQ